PLRRIDRASFASDDAARKRVLHECAARSAVMRRYAAMIRFVLGEERARAARKFEDVGAEVGFVEEAGEGGGVRVVGQQTVFTSDDDRRLVLLGSPRPRVAVPEVRDEVNRRALGPAIVRGDAEDGRLLIFLRDLDLDVEVTIVVEDAGVEQLELAIVRAACAIFVN